MTNIPSMAVGKMVNQLSEAYSTVINNGLPIRTMPSVMLWGPPGVGKSQAVREIANEIGVRTGKSVNVTDVRLLLFNPIFCFLMKYTQLISLFRRQPIR